MFSNNNCFFSPDIPAEIVSIILKNIPVNKLIAYRVVNKAWRDLIDNLLFDETLLANPSEKIPFYVPVFLPLRCPQHKIEWDHINNAALPRYFYRSMKDLFAHIDAKGCYTVTLSLDEMKKKENKMRIEFYPVRRYYLLHAVAANKILSYTSRDKPEKELTNPFFSSTIPRNDQKKGLKIR